MDIQDYANGVSAKAVIRFLNKNPDFLAENPAVFEKQDLGLKNGSIVDFQRLSETSMCSDHRWRAAQKKTNNDNDNDNSCVPGATGRGGGNGRYWPP